MYHVRLCSFVHGGVLSSFVHGGVLSRYDYYSIHVSYVTQVAYD